MLLEALIAILIFSIGILAIVGMQATALQDLGEAKYRTEASFLANQVIAEIWGGIGTDPNQVATNLANFAYGGSGSPPPMIADWVNHVQGTLPGAQDYPPIITVGADSSVAVTVRWRAPRETGEKAPPHSYKTVAYISL